MSMLIEPLGLQCAIAGFDGGVFVNPDLSVIESHTLDAATAKQTVKLILDHGLDAWVYTPDEWLIRNRDAPYVARETNTVKFDAKVVAFFTDAHLAHAVKITGISSDLGLVAACEKVAQSSLGDKASAARSQPYYLDVTSPQATKAAVVATLSKLLNIPPAQIATMGDMPNDVSMFRASGFSIAMGNSSDEVKSQASAVTDSNENEGFAKAVRKFVLRQTAGSKSSTLVGSIPSVPAFPLIRRRARRNGRPGPVRGERQKGKGLAYADLAGCRPAASRAPATGS